MFCGEYEHNLDEKSRLVIPAKFRAFIRDEHDREGFYLLVSPAPDEKCLRLYTPSVWRNQVRAIRREAEKMDNPTEFYRLYAAQAEFIPADTQSRIVLPQKRLDEVGLSREILLVGTFQWIEVWDPGEYRDSRNRAREKYRENLTRSVMPDEAEDL
jgi:MraZ protein